jgi:hypothetical protein
MLRKLAGLLSAVVIASALVIAPAAPASASTLFMTIWWIRCDDQSEPFSDEIRLRFAGLGGLGYVARWTDVDGGETHWYWSSSPQPVNLQFTGNHPIDVIEEDGSTHELIGWVNTFASEADQGAKEKRMFALDGDYVVRYEIRTTPCC